MTHFGATGVRTGRPETLTLVQKLRVAAAGVDLPKPRNEATPLDRIFEALPAPKQFEVFDGLGHQSLLRGNPDRWTLVVSAFLARIRT